MNYRSRINGFNPIDKQARWGHQFAYTPVDDLDPPKHTIYPSFICAEDDAPLHCFIYTFAYDLVAQDTIVRNLPRNSEPLRETIENLLAGMTFEEAWRAAYNCTDNKKTAERLLPLLGEEQRLPPEYRRGLEEFADERL